MHLKKYILSLFFSIIGFIPLHAQLIENISTADSTGTKNPLSPDSVLVKYIQLNVDAAYKVNLFSKPLNNFHVYDPIKKYNAFYANLGNFGSASTLLYYQPNLSADFKYREDVFAPYRLHSDSLKFYMSKNPFSHLYYTMGAKNNQKLDVDISQRIGTGLYLGLSARVSSELGLYVRQQTQYAGGNFYALFFPPSKRYGAIANITFDKAKIQENGGISEPNIFKENNEKTRKTYRVNLSDAQNNDKMLEVTLQHYFNILKQINTKDTLHRQIKTLAKREFDAGRIIHTFKYSQMSSGYEDKMPMEQVYPYFNLKPGMVTDTLKIKKLENSFVYSNETPDTSAKAFPFQYSFGIKLENANIQSNNTNDLSNHQVVSFGSLKGIIAGKTYFTASGYFITGGYRAADYTMEGNFYQFFGKKNNRVYANFTQAVLKPDYIYNYYTSKNISWDNGLDKTILVKGLAGLEIKDLDVNVSYIIIKNHTYFNSKIQVQQYTSPISIFAAKIEKNVAWKHWIMNALGRAQYITPDSIIKVPLFMGRLSICYDNWFFSKALHGQIGIAATYHTTWKQNAYAPSIRAFYPQNNYTSGNYPYFDAFVNLNVKRARLFFKYEHFNSFFFPKEYMMVPYYPQPDALFRFGVSWLFFD